MSSLPIRLQVALKRAAFVARTNIDRAVAILVAARVQFAAAVRFVLTCATSGAAA
jgi:hypothetical protein